MLNSYVICSLRLLWIYTCWCFVQQSVRCSSDIFTEPKQILQGSQEGTRILTMSTRVMQQAASGICTHMKKTLDAARPLRNWISLMLCVTSIFMDPLFFYIPMIKMDRKCLDLDKNLGVIACVFRSVVDLFYIIYVRYYIGYKPYIDLLAVLPLPQVVIIIFVSKMSLTNFLAAMNMLKYSVFLQFVPRVIRIYPLFKKATSSRILTEVTWTKAAFNLYLYVISGHVFGALWYIFAIEREINCWKKVCKHIVKIQTRCNHLSFNCHENSRNYRFLHGNCSTKPHHHVDYKFGIFRDALQSGVLEGSFLHKFMYCFRWGLQSLSCFAQNLTTSIAISENIFTISITISSVVLFIFLLGNMQLYLQSETIGLEEKKLRVREIEQWPSFRMLSRDLRKRVLNHQRHVWQETKGVDVENCLNNLPNDLRRDIKSEFCFKKINKVPGFQNSLGNRQFLDALYDRLKPVLYPKDIYIVQESDPITQMLFIIRGQLTVKTINGERPADHPEFIDFYGGELLTSNQPISKRTVKVQSVVEAFALEADDLMSLVSQFSLKPLQNNEVCASGSSEDKDNELQDAITTNTGGSSPSSVVPSEMPQKPVKPDLTAKEQ